MGKISFCIFARKLIERKERKEEEVDILIVGDVVMAELSGLIRSEEEKRSKEINYTVMTEEEFSFRKKRRDPFLWSILESGKVLIIGDENELYKTN